MTLRLAPEGAIRRAASPAQAGQPGAPHSRRRGRAGRSTAPPGCENDGLIETREPLLSYLLSRAIGMMSQERRVTITLELDP